MLIKQEIDKYYNNLLKGLGGYILDIYNIDYYEKENNNYINKTKIYNFKYIKDMLNYYITLPLSTTFILMQDILISRIYAYLYNANITYEEKTIIVNQFFNKLKEEKIEELIILYKLRRK